MGILFSEVKYYNSELIDFTDSALNGKGVGTEITNDTMHSIFPEISATERETGFTRYAKVFVSNESTTRKMQDCIFYIKQDVAPPDRLKLYEATESAHYEFNITSTLSGDVSAVAAGTSIDIDTFSPVTAVAADFVGREFEIGGLSYIVVSSPTLSTITFDRDVAVEIVAGSTAATVDDFDTLEAGEDFVLGKKLVNSVIKSTVIAGTMSISIPIADKLLFETGDPIVIVDGYFRATYRGVVDTVADHGTDTALAVVTLTTAYTSTSSIPANEGFICNGAKQSLLPGQKKSFWLELTIDVSNAIDAEIINQFQMGTHFDDVTA